MIWLHSLFTVCILAAGEVFAGDVTTDDSKTMVSLRTHSIYAPYVDHDLQNRWFSFGGDAYVNTNKHVRLTQDRRSETGWLWSRLPIGVPSFQIDIEFKIGGEGSHLFGDGMAFWLTKTRAEFGPVFGSKDSFEGLGIFVDTYANSRHTYSFPRIMGMIGDGKTRYDLDRDGQANEAGACSAKVRGVDIATKVRITSMAGQGVSVKLQYKGWDEWTPCFELKNYTMIANPYLGVTAITGDVHDAHDVVSITSHSIINSAPPTSGVKPNDRRPSNESSGGWLWFIFKWFACVGLIAGGVEVYKVYVVKNGQWSNKRF